jgi:putative ABC transport system ATP-binding protein
MAVSGNLVSFQNVTREYSVGAQKVSGLAGIDWELPTGSFLGVTGPSGSGKSTLLNLLSLVDEPTQGKILFEGKSISGMGDDAMTDFRNLNIGIVFQSFNLIPVMTAEENVSLALRIRGVPANERRERSEALLVSVGLGKHLRHRPDQLSGGQKQRVAVARALITEPKLVVADEPTAALDSATAREIVELMKNLNRDKGTTFVLSTHDARLMDVIEEKISLEDGRIKS